MIRSVEHNYLFVQLPRTGCTAVARELLEHYSGERILAKHSRHHEYVESEFHNSAFTVFSTVRHPLDDLVSSYEKLRTNHEKYLDPERHQSQPRGYISDDTIEQFRFVSGGGGFHEYLRRYHRLPFDNWSSLAHQSFDHVMRFESLAHDFERVLRHLGITPVRALPSRNTTERTKPSWVSYYEDPAVQAFIAPRVFPFMRRWNYDFPDSWNTGPTAKLWAGEAVFRIVQPRRRRFWVKPAPGFEDGK